MTPVDQDRFFDAEAGTRGNCMQAAFASLLDFPLRAVPNFAEMPSHEWHENLFRWLGFLGLDVENVYPPGAAPSGYAMASGLSPRGVLHMVIVKDGELVHDPHPSRAGVQTIECYWTIVPLTDDRAARMEAWK